MGDSEVASGSFVLKASPHETLALEHGSLKQQ